MPSCITKEIAQILQAVPLLHQYLKTHWLTIRLSWIGPRSAILSSCGHKTNQTIKNLNIWKQNKHLWFIYSHYMNFQSKRVKMKSTKLETLTSKYGGQSRVKIKEELREISMRSFAYYFRMDVTVLTMGDVTKWALLPRWNPHIIRTLSAEKKREKKGEWW